MKMKKNELTRKEKRKKECVKIITEVLSIICYSCIFLGIGSAIYYINLLYHYSGNSNFIFINIILYLVFGFFSYGYFNTKIKGGQE